MYKLHIHYYYYTYATYACNYCQIVHTLSLLCCGNVINQLPRITIYYQEFSAERACECIASRASVSQTLVA